MRKAKGLSEQQKERVIDFFIRLAGETRKKNEKNLSEQKGFCSNLAQIKRLNPVHKDKII